MKSLAVFFFFMGWKKLGFLQKSWRLGGEEIQISSDKIILSRRLGSWIESQEYKRPEIEKFSVLYRNNFFEKSEMSVHSFRKMHNWKYGRININLSGKIAAFAMDVSHADAEIILDRIARKFPHYVPDRQTG